jgi:hypothetical protein
MVDPSQRHEDPPRPVNRPAYLSPDQQDGDPCCPDDAAGDAPEAQPIPSSPSVSRHGDETRTAALTIAWLGSPCHPSQRTRRPARSNLRAWVARYSPASVSAAGRRRRPWSLSGSGLPRSPTDDGYVPATEGSLPRTPTRRAGPRHGQSACLIALVLPMAVKQCLCHLGGGSESSRWLSALTRSWQCDGVGPHPGTANATGAFAPGWGDGYPSGEVSHTTGSELSPTGSRSPAGCRA